MLVAMGVLVFVLFVLVFSQTAFNIKQLHPGSVEQTLLLVVLSTLVFLLLVALTFVLLRNLLKLYAERQLGVLGSRFRTRMVVAALLLSFAPAIVMFMFAYGLMNRSIDKWFSGPVEQIQQDSGYVAKILFDYAGDNARQEAVEIAASPDVQHAFETANYTAVLHEFRRHQPTLEGGFAVAIADDNAVAGWKLPGPWGALRGQFPRLQQLEKEPQKWSGGNMEYVLAGASVQGSGRILVALPLPKDFVPTLDQINKNQRSFLALSRETKRIRGMYMLVLT